MPMDSGAGMTVAEKKRLPKSDFAYVDADGKGHLPIHDAEHARNALARLNQTDIPDEAKRKALKKILAACKKFGVEVDMESDVMKQYGADAGSLEDDLEQVRRAYMDSYMDKPAMAEPMHGFIRATYPEYLIVEKDDKCYRVDYSKDGDEYKFGDPVEVVITYQEASMSEQADAAGRKPKSGVGPGGGNPDYKPSAKYEGLKEVYRRILVGLGWSEDVAAEAANWLFGFEKSDPGRDPSDPSQKFGGGGDNPSLSIKGILERKMLFDKPDKEGSKSEDPNKPRDPEQKYGAIVGAFAGLSKDQFMALSDAELASRLVAGIADEIRTRAVADYQTRESAVAGRVKALDDILPIPEAERADVETKVREADELAFAAMKIERYERLRAEKASASVDQPVIPSLRPGKSNANANRDPFAVTVS